MIQVLMNLHLLVDSKAKVYGKKKPANKSQPQSEKERHVQFDSNVDISLIQI